MATAPPDTRIAAGRSSRAALLRLSGNRRIERAAATSPMGTLTQKIQCQSSPLTTAPPIKDPAATARPPMAPQIPTAALRRSAGNAPVRMVRLKLFV
jgi:hypothetical protein